MAKYPVTQEEYNILLREYKRLGLILENVEIVSRAQKLESDKLPQIRGVSGILNQDKMKALFGVNYKNILYYTFETGRWNKSNYLGCQIWNGRYNTSNVKKIKQNIEERYNYLEILGVAVMPVSLKKYKNAVTGTIIENPKYMAKGLGVVGAVICRDRRFGQIMGVAGNWIMIDAYKSTDDLVQAAVSRFAVECVMNWEFCTNLMQYYK